MDGFVEGVRIDKRRGSYGTLPSGCPPVIFKSKTNRGVRQGASLSAREGYEQYDTKYYDWWIVVHFWHYEKDKKSEWTDTYCKESTSRYDGYWEYRDRITEDGLRREEEMTELFNNIVKDIQAGKRDRKDHQRIRPRLERHRQTHFLARRTFTLKG